MARPVPMAAAGHLGCVRRLLQAGARVGVQHPRTGLTPLRDIQRLPKSELIRFGKDGSDDRRHRRIGKFCQAKMP